MKKVKGVAPNYIHILAAASLSRELRGMRDFELIFESELMTNEEEFLTKEDMANDTVLWKYTYMLWEGCVYKVTGDYEQDGRGVRNIVMTLIENYYIVKDSIKNNNGDI